MSLTAESSVVIVGAGQAAAETAAELRRQPFAGRIVMIAEEAHPPYKRPPLSKTFLAGTATEESLYVQPRAALEKANIELHTGLRATRIRRAEQQLDLSDGSSLAYDRLVLATGSRARPLPLGERSNVFPLRGIADVQNIRAVAAAGKRAVIIGGGFIGLEAAAVLVKQGLQVTVLEAAPRVLARVCSAPVSSFFERVHRESGVTVLTGVAVDGFVGEPVVTAVRLKDGRELPADLVIAGIGILPNVELAAEAGLAVTNGIEVDAFTQTSDPNIYAAGDCTEHPSDYAGRRLRLESVQNALEQGRACAQNLMGKATPYQMIPWFWSDQYDVKLQMVGLTAPDDRIVLRGSPESGRSFIAFYLRAGVLVAADTVNRPADFQLLRKMVAARAVPEVAALADEAVAIKTLA